MQRAVRVACPEEIHTVTADMLGLDALNLQVTGRPTGRRELLSQLNNGRCMQLAIVSTIKTLAH
jgi:hypothetical protein